MTSFQQRTYLSDQDTASPASPPAPPMSDRGWKEGQRCSVVNGKKSGWPDLEAANTVPLADGDGPWVECRESCGFRATMLSGSFDLYDLERPCKTWPHKIGHQTKAKMYLVHLGEVFGEPLASVKDPSLWVAWYDRTNSRLQTQHTSKRSRLKGQGVFVNAVTIRRSDGPFTLVVSTVDLSTNGVTGSWVPRMKAFEIARSWLNGPGVKGVRFTQESRWPFRRSSSDGLKLIPGHTASAEVRAELNRMGARRPYPADYPDRRVPSGVKLRYENQVIRAADLVRKRLQERA